MKGEERKARLVVEESARDGKEGVKVSFEGTLDRYSAFIAVAISNYRDAIVKSYGPDAKKVVNESLKELVDLEGTDDELKEFSAKVFSKLKDIDDLDYEAMLERLLLRLLDDIKKDIEDSAKND